MKISYKYKGRSFSSAKSMFDAMQRDVQRDYERKIRSAAAGAGASVRKIGKDFHIECSHEQLENSTGDLAANHRRRNWQEEHVRAAPFRGDS